MLDISKNNELAVSKPFPGTTAYAFGQVIDLGRTGRDVGAGEDLYLVIASDSTGTFSGTCTNVSVDVVSTDSEPANTAGVIADAGVALTTPTVHVTGDVYANVAGMPAAGVINTIWKIIELPPGIYKRYLTLRGNFATAQPATGKLNAFLTTEPNIQRIYPQGLPSVTNFNA